MSRRITETAVAGNASEINVSGQQVIEEGNHPQTRTSEKKNSGTGAMA